MVHATRLSGLGRVKVTTDRLRHSWTQTRLVGDQTECLQTTIRQHQHEGISLARQDHDITKHFKVLKKTKFLFIHHIPSQNHIVANNENRWTFSLEERKY